MMRFVDRPPNNGRLARAYKPVPSVLDELKEHVGIIISEARDIAQSLKNGPESACVRATTLPPHAIERARLSLNDLRAGVPSKRSFVYSLSSLRRAVLELEGFLIWAKICRAPTTSASSITSAYKDEHECEYRSAFLNGNQQEWLDPSSDVRRTYSRLVHWGIPLYAWVNARDWDTRANQIATAWESPFSVKPAVKGNRISL